MDSYDVVVLGAGPGGYVAAIRAAQLGLETAIVEPDAVGGLCLNWGCIPSKALLRNAEVLTLVNHASDFGIAVGSVEADLDSAITRSRRVVNRLVKGVESLLRKNKVTVIQGHGTLKDARSITVGDDEVQARRAIILATGAQDRVLPGLEPDGQAVVTSRHALERRELPPRVVIIGGGATGCEFAYFYRAYGSEVTLVEVMPHLLPSEDEEVAKALEEAFKKQGITVLSGSRVERLDRHENGGVVHTSSDKGTIEVPFDMCLIAVGTQGRTEGLGLEAAGVTTEKGGFVAITDRMETTAPGVYAIGDMTGSPLLAHVAMAQGVLAAEAIAGRETRPLSYVDMPRAVYCHPQVASLGLTEAEARENGRQVSVGRFPYQASGKALSLADADGFIKIVSDTKTGELLGAQMIGPECTELLGELSVARMLESTPLEIGRAVHPHPTLSEVLMEAALGAQGEAIHI